MFYLLHCKVKQSFSYMQYYRKIFYCIYASLTIASKGMRKPQTLHDAAKSARFATKEQGGQTNDSAEEKKAGAGCRSKANGR